MCAKACVCGLVATKGAAFLANTILSHNLNFNLVAGVDVALAGRNKDIFDHTDCSLQCQRWLLCICNVLVTQLQHSNPNIITFKMSKSSQWMRQNVHLIVQQRLQQRRCSSTGTVRFTLVTSN